MRLRLGLCILRAAVGVVLALVEVACLEQATVAATSPPNGVATCIYDYPTDFARSPPAESVPHLRGILSNFADTVGDARLQTTEIYTQVSIRHLQQIHAGYHPAARNGVEDRS